MAREGRDFRIGGRQGIATDLFHGLIDGRPTGVPTADNETDWRESLAKLAALVEAGL